MKMPGAWPTSSTAKWSNWMVPLRRGRRPEPYDQKFPRSSRGTVQVTWVLRSASGRVPMCKVLAQTSRLGSTAMRTTTQGITTNQWTR